MMKNFIPKPFQGLFDRELPTMDPKTEIDPAKMSRRLPLLVGALSAIGAGTSKLMDSKQNTRGHLLKGLGGGIGATAGIFAQPAIYELTKNLGASGKMSETQLKYLASTLQLAAVAGGGVGGYKLADYLTQPSEEERKATERDRQDAERARARDKIPARDWGFKAPNIDWGTFFPKDYPQKAWQSFSNRFNPTTA